MADISKLKLGSTIYSLKDSEARAAISTIEIAAASSLIFKGVVSSATDITELTNYKIGWTYKANAAFEIASIGKIEVGDMLICVGDYKTSYKSTDWTVVQNNVDIMIGATAATAGTSGLVPAPSITEGSKFLQGDGTWGNPSIEWGDFNDLI